MSLSEMLQQAETQLGRKLTQDEYAMVATAHQRGMTLEQIVDAVNATAEQPTPRPRPPRVFRYEAVGKQVQPIGVAEDG